MKNGTHERRFQVVGETTRPDCADSSSPKFADHERHVAAVIAAGGFTVLPPYRRAA